MIGRVLKIRGAKAAAVLALLLAGCGHTPPTTFFTLDPVAGSAPAPGASMAPIRVQSVHLPPEFDRPQLITRPGGGDQVRLHEFAQWAGPVGALARNALTLDLSSRLPAGAVIAPDAPRPANTRLLTVDILALRLTGGEAQVTAIWTLAAPAPSKGPAPAAVSQTERFSVPAGSTDDPAAEAEALTRVLGVLSDRMVRALSV